MIHLLELGIEIRVGGGCHDAEELLRANHQFHPVCPSLAKRLDGFIPDSDIIRALVGKHDAVL